MALANGPCADGDRSAAIAAAALMMLIVSGFLCQSHVCDIKIFYYN